MNSSHSRQYLVKDVHMYAYNETCLYVNFKRNLSYVVDLWVGIIIYLLKREKGSMIIKQKKKGFSSGCVKLSNQNAKAGYRSPLKLLR